MAAKVCVVSYFNSTSNHNDPPPRRTANPVVSYFNSTSNHNWSGRTCRIDVVVSYFNSISNHNQRPWRYVWDGVVSYFNSISNHNKKEKERSSLSVVSYFNSISNHNSDMRFVDCHSVMWPNERYERRMTGRGSRNDAGFVFQRYFSLKVECTSRARNRYMFAK